MHHGAERSGATHIRRRSPPFPPSQNGSPSLAAHSLTQYQPPPPVAWPVAHFDDDKRLLWRRVRRGARGRGRRTWRWWGWGPRVVGLASRTRGGRGGVRREGSSSSSAPLSPAWRLRVLVATAVAARAQPPHGIANRTVGTYDTFYFLFVCAFPPIRQHIYNNRHFYI
jgi:hypothetical protein